VIDYSETSDGITFRVFVVPRASKSQITGEHNGALRVRLAAAPVEGAANEELIRLLGRTMKLPRNAITIIRGHNARQKTISVSGADASALKALGIL